MLIFPSLPIYYTSAKLWTVQVQHSKLYKCNTLNCTSATLYTVQVQHSKLYKCKTLRLRLHWSQKRHNTTVWIHSRQGSNCLCQRLHWNRSDWSVISPDCLASTKWVCLEPTVWPDTRFSVHRICNGQNVLVFKRTSPFYQLILLFMSAATSKLIRLECHLPRLSGANKVSLFPADNMARYLLQYAWDSRVVARHKTYLIELLEIRRLFGTKETKITITEISSQKL